MKLPAKFAVGTIKEYNRNTLKNRLLKIGIVIFTFVLICLIAYAVIIFAYEQHNKADIKCKPPQGYSISGGRLIFNNVGKLPAQKIKVAWKIVKIESKKQAETNYSGSDERKELPAGEEWVTSFSSNFKDDEQNLFLIIAWKYEGKGIKKYVFKHEDYYWNTYWDPPAWAMTSRIDYQSQLSVVDNEVIPEFKKKLGIND